MAKDIILPIINSTLKRKYENRNQKLGKDKSGQSYHPQYHSALQNFKKTILNARSQLRDFIGKSDLQNIKIFLTEKRNHVRQFLDNLVKNEALINLEYFLFSKKTSSTQKPQQYQFKPLKQSKRPDLSKLLQQIKLPPSPNLNLQSTNYPAPIFPLDESMPLSTREQVFLQYVFIIVGGALVLAI